MTAASPSRRPSCGSWPARAVAIGAEIDAIGTRLRTAPDEAARRSGFRLPDAAGWAYDVRDGAGAGSPMCAGHARDARAHLIGAVITPLT